MSLLETDGERLLTALLGLLAQKGLVSDVELQERIAITDKASPGQIAVRSNAT